MCLHNMIWRTKKLKLITDFPTASNTERETKGIHIFWTLKDCVVSSQKQAWKLKTQGVYVYCVSKKGTDLLRLDTWNEWKLVSLNGWINILAFFSHWIVICERNVGKSKERTCSRVYAICFFSRRERVIIYLSYFISDNIFNNLHASIAAVSIQLMPSESREKKMWGAPAECPPFELL